MGAAAGRVVELNGAVEFSRDYAPWGDVFVDTALALTRQVHARRAWGGALATPTAS